MNLVPLIAETNFDSVMNNGLSLSEKAMQSLQMLLMGMGTVFSVLFTIWLALTLFKVFMHDIPEKRRAKAKEKEKATADTAPVMPVAEEPVAEETPVTTDDMSVTVAVITAAIQAYMDSQGIGDTPFKVVSFKRKGPAVPWNGSERI